jgi:hypothetical protein
MVDVEVQSCHEVVDRIVVVKDDNESDDDMVARGKPT